MEEEEMRRVEEKAGELIANPRLTKQRRKEDYNKRGNVSKKKEELERRLLQELLQGNIFRFAGLNIDGD
jgi:hypothetical protein